MKDKRGKTSLFLFYKRTRAYGSSLLLDNGMRLRSERTAALCDVRKQPSNTLAVYECSKGASYPKLSSWRKSHFHSLRLGEHKKHKAYKGPCVEQGVKAV